MKLINNVTLTGIIGFVGKSVPTKNGSMCNFSLGFGNGKDKDNKAKYGNVRCTTFDTAVVDNVINLGKGAKVLVTGRIAENDYTNKEGKEIKEVILIVDNVCQ